MTTTPEIILNDIDNAESQAEMDEAVKRSIAGLADDLATGLTTLTSAALANPYADAPPVAELLASALAEAVDSLGAGYFS